MRLIFLAILVLCAALCCVIAYTAWQAGGPGAFEALAAVGAVGVLAWLLPIVWRESGPVHEGGDDAHLRVRSPMDAADACEREAERTWTN